MTHYIDKIKPVCMRQGPSAEKEDRATNEEESAYRSLAGVLMFLGNAILPRAAMFTSKMQQKIGWIQVKDILQENIWEMEVIKMKYVIRFVKPGRSEDVKLISISDAVHGGGEIYGQSGRICGMLIATKLLSPKLFLPISWRSHKQRRVSYSDFGAEILTATDEDDGG